ncbi:hypothetical protein F7Q99_16970 [Streptomyces kaniharaensis]|uniref:Uncharacterized protein n=1 Tax=Streptomyces kaniharaensis TaxID=212423 RepID=A0A6N7KQT9_9ACTN|nr:hypothetical protein [Streptomyces kaniharaensis]MQS13916.1 hypothetical protein [Streptomyces kaniharaensis]
MENIMITKMTGQTVVAASLRAARLRAFAELGGTGLGLDTTGVSVVPAAAVSGPGHTDLCVAGGRSVEGTSVETGLSRDWASFGTPRSLRDERPTQAPKAVVAAATHGGYAQVIGAGNPQKQNEQQINQAMAAFIGAKAIRMRAFRGPEPWRERT